LTVQTGVPDSPAVLLLSHVLTELELPAIDHLVKRAEQATCIVWVEPGTYAASRALIGVREHLRDRFEVVSPCTHQAACGMLAPGNERHWCHHFAKPPAYVFTDSDWGRFARLLEIDLRSVPLSYLVLDRRPAPLRLRELSRVIGRPRVYKPEARVHLCNAQGIGDFRLTRRDLPEEFRRMKKGEVDTLVQARADGDRLTEFSPWAGDQS
jgi:ribosomal protein RSM22 (predicted rRNA methylase)